MLEGTLSVSLRSLPSQALRASSPAGGAKRTPVNRGKLCGKATLLQLCLTTYFANTNARALGSPCGGAGTGCASALRLRGEQTNNAGAGFRQPPQRDPIFRDAKFFCFGAINNRRNNWCFTPYLSSHEKGGAFEPAGFYACQLLISIPVMVQPELL